MAVLTGLNSLCPNPAFTAQAGYHSEKLHFTEGLIYITFTKISTNTRANKQTGKFKISVVWKRQFLESNYFSSLLEKQTLIKYQAE